MIIINFYKIGGVCCVTGDNVSICSICFCLILFFHSLLVNLKPNFRQKWFNINETMITMIENAGLTMSLFDLKLKLKCDNGHFHF